MRKVSTNIAEGLGETKDAGSFVDPWLWKQKEFAENLQSDPFVPETIRTAIFKFYLERFYALTDICCEVFEDACNEYSHTEQSYGSVNKLQNEVSGSGEPGILIYSQVLERQKATQYSYERSREMIIEFRTMIEKYLISSMGH
jgi:hypothetical protein